MINRSDMVISFYYNSKRVLYQLVQHPFLQMHINCAFLKQSRNAYETIVHI